MRRVEVWTKGGLAGLLVGGESWWVGGVRLSKRRVLVVGDWGVLSKRRVFTFVCIEPMFMESEMEIRQCLRVKKEIGL